MVTTDKDLGRCKSCGVWIIATRRICANCWTSISAGL